MKNDSHRITVEIAYYIRCCKKQIMENFVLFPANKTGKTPLPKVRSQMETFRALFHNSFTKNRKNIIRIKNRDTQYPEVRSLSFVLKHQNSLQSSKISYTKVLFTRGDTTFGCNSTFA